MPLQLVPSFLKSTLLNLLAKLGYRIIAINDLDDQFDATQSTAFLSQVALSKRVSTAAMVIFDVGSNTGQAYSSYRKLFPDAMIYCFEPYHESYTKLASLASRDSNAVLCQVAISNESGSAFFNVNSNSETNSLLQSSPQSGQYWGPGLLETKVRLEVEKTTLDLFAKASNVNHISILKLDIQGGEYDALEGASELLQSRSIDIIYTEIILCETYDRQRHFYEYLQLLKRHGYSLVDFYNSYHNGIFLNQVDAIFVSPKLL